MTRPLLDVPPIDNGACGKPLTRIHTMQPQERHEAGQKVDAVFFPTRMGGRRQELWVERAEQEAKTVCKTCPELNTCREWVLAREAHTGELEAGVWGALGIDDRATILRNHNKKVRDVVDAREDVA